MRPWSARRPADVLPTRTRARRASSFGSLPAPDGEGKTWGMAGGGDAGCATGSGEGRLDSVRRDAERLLGPLVEIRHPSVGNVPAPRLHGGVAFRPEPSRHIPWTSFADASFVLPRWSYGVCEDAAFFRWIARPEDRIDEPAIDAILALLRTLEDSHAPPETAAAIADIERADPTCWRALVRDALDRIRAHELDKVVPMALTRICARAPFQPQAVLARLAVAYPDCVRFAFQRGDAIFLGATPERLVAKKRLSLEVDALAGSAARGPEGEDGRAAAKLLESEKDRWEHRLVVDAICRALAPVCVTLNVLPTPVVRTLHNVRSSLLANLRHAGASGARARSREDSASDARRLRHAAGGCAPLARRQ